MSEKGSNLVEELKNVSSEDMLNMLIEDKPAAAAIDPNKPADPPAAQSLVDAMNGKEPAAKVETDPPAAKVVDKPIDPPANPDPSNLVDKDKPADDKLSLDPNKDKPASLEFSLDAPADSNVEDNGWKDVAKEWEIELETDTIEAFKEKLDDHYKSKYEINLGKYKPETQAVIEFIEAGGDIKELHEPLKAFHDLKALPDAELVYRDLELRKWTLDLIEKEITRQTEANELDLNAHKIRETIDTIISTEEQKMIQTKLNAKERNDAFKQNNLVQERNEVKTSIKESKDFMTIPLPQKVIDTITTNLESGKYDSLLKDPKVKAEFILFKELGSQAITFLQEKEALKYKTEKHNIPPLQSAGGAAASAATQTGKKAEGNWEALNGAFGNQEE